MKRFQDYEVPEISDVLNRLFALDPAIACQTQKRHRLCGPVCTVRVFPGDNLMVHKALDVAKPNDIVIIDAHGARGVNAVLGDTTKGGRKPSETETRSLTGRQRHGVPLGLKQCARCREWRGECIDPNPLIGGLVVRVHCLCENRNLCARCGERFCERKVNANYYCEQDGTVWHVPGFSALKHRCVGGPKWLA
jgi:hypothetical protein